MADALFPHQKLDWLISRLEDKVHERPDDPQARLELARALISRGLFHSGMRDGAERECNRAFGTLRKVLQEDPGNAEAHTLAGLALLGMSRPEGALKYLDQALRLDPERADLRLALGMLAREQGDLGAAVRQCEGACRKAPDSWETHTSLARALMDLARSQGWPQRLVERSQFHLVRALRLGAPPDQQAPLFRDMGITCMRTGRHRDAEKFFIRLREHDRFRTEASLHLGRVAYELGKYNNAIQHFRAYLRDRPEDADVLARVAMCWFQLGEFSRAREACNQALMREPMHLEARQALGATLLEEGQPNEALRVFRETLKEVPGYLPAYLEMVRTRRRGGDGGWLQQALTTEVRNHDRLPQGGRSGARTLTRQRVGVVLDELKALGPGSVGGVLSSIEHTQDEGLRFQLWESACDMAVGAVADRASSRLRAAGTSYGPALGAEALAGAGALPDPVLIEGLNLDEGDIKKAAVDRYPPADDVRKHREQLAKERDRARAHQAMLLVAIGARRSAAGKALLRDWAETADPELASAAWAALAMYGEPEATRRLRDRAVQRGAVPVVERLLSGVTPAAGTQPRRVSDGEHTRCSTCGRAPHEVSHMMAGGDSVICDRCVMRIATHRRSMTAADDAVCNLCHRTHFEAAVFTYNGHQICNHCLELSLGLLEREEVDRFLAEW
ncbi:MAG: tetratricopeptide repeat protein [Alphaproteobacteria bacterium]|nr:tetratricopeptide repeat protein [Alphaproteobacteria bacterium]